MMRGNVESQCDLHAERQDCPDALIDFYPASKAYGIMIHDGGSSMIKIAYCPWCGIRLPEVEE
jgi:hypothetical protein